MGQTWTVQATQPWSSRLRNVLVADPDNFVYAAGGTVTDATVYFSWNKGVIWTALQQSSSTYIPSPVEFVTASLGCQSMRFASDFTTVAASYTHKQLVMYGGIGQITLATPGTCAITSTATAVYAEMMFPSDLQCHASGTGCTSPINSAPPPNATINDAQPLFNATERYNPGCAVDIHASGNMSSSVGMVRRTIKAPCGSITALSRPRCRLIAD
jgi:hypothetical protein